MVPIASSPSTQSDSADAFSIQTELGLQLTFDQPVLGADQGLDGYRLTLEARGISASIRVENSHRHSSPCFVFEQMARDQRGWSGKIIWRAEDGEYGLTAVYAKAGYVVLSVEVEDMVNDWSLLAHLEVEPEQLGLLEQQAKAFFRS